MTDISSSIRCLVTGGAGFIGSNLVDALASRGYPVVVVDDLSTGRRANLEAVTGRAELHEQTVTADLGDLLDGVDVAFHLAANVFITRSVDDPVFDATVNVLGTINLLEACRRADVRRVVFASSSSVYGDPVRLPIAEDHPLSPKSPYAASKLAGEQYMLMYHRFYGLETVCLRFFNVYGPRQRADSPYSGVVAQFCERARRGEPLVVHGDGSQTRDFVHVSDVVAACLAAAESGKAPGGIYNVGSGEPTSILQLAGTVVEASGRKVAFKHLPHRPGDVSNSVADISAARKDMGYSSSVCLRDGISGLVRQPHGSTKLHLHQ